ncbi:MAG: BACON domain-containing protein [Bryobacteraceae bacterium]
MPVIRAFRLFAFWTAFLAASAGISRAQNIVASPASLMFNVQSRGATSPAQTVQITSSGAAFTFVASAPASAPWLIVSQTSSTTPATLSVTVNPTTLVPGTYNTAVSIAGAGTANSPLMIPVTVVVAGQTGATASPAVLTFNSQAGAQVPPQVVNISTGGAPGPFLVAATSSPTNWLAVDRTNGTTPSDVTVSVNPGSLPAGVYMGNLLFTVPGAINSPVTVTVTLNVTSAAQLTASPASLAFNFQIGQAAPAAQVLNVSAGGASVAFNVTAATINGPATWLVVNSVTAVTPGSANIGINPAGLAAGVYNGTLTVSSANATNITVPVMLTVSSLPLLSATPGALAFNYQSGGAALTPQTVALTSSTGTIGYTAAVATTTGGPWLQVSPTTASTPASLTVTADPTGLAAGIYDGTITLTLTGAGVATVTIPVTLSVNSTPALTATPQTVAFFAQLGGANPAGQVITVGSTSGTLGFSAVATTTSGGNWLTVTGGGTATPTVPGQITATANAANLMPGTYNGVITITAPGVATGIQVQASLTVSTLPLLTVSPTTFSFSYQQGAPGVPATQQLSIGSTTPGLNFAIVATTSDGANWLSVSQMTGSAPALVGVTINPTGLNAGNYTGTLSVSSPGAGNSPQNVTVSLTVTAAALTVTPTALNFTQQMSGPAPASQALTVSNAGGAAGFSAVAATTTGGNWLSVMPASGTTPSQLMVAVNGAGLAQGTYSGTITITPTTPFGPAGAMVTVAVTLTVGASQTIAVAPSALTFAFQAGGQAPASQTFSVTGTASLPFTVAAAATSGGNWLSATPASGSASATATPITVSVNPAGLAPGAYSGSVTVVATGASNSPQVVNVTLVVTSIPPPSLTALVNAASFVNGPVSPGEIVTLGGTRIGPATLTVGTVTSGTVDTTVAGTRVLFDGIPAPIIYASGTQTSAIVPYALAGRRTAQAQVIVNGVASNLFGLAVAPSAPGIFTINSAGSGQGAILNQDGSLNSSGNPSTVGQVIVIYATGEGATDPAGSDGEIVGSDLRKPVLPVTVKIGGQPAQVNYQGSAPGLVAGVLQVNAVVPPGAGTGNVAVEIKAGSNASQPNVTVALQ